MRRDKDDPKVRAVASAIRYFNWANFGLDEVVDADPAYATELALKIVNRLDRENITVATDSRQ